MSEPMTADLTPLERVARAIQSVPVGPLGPNALAIVSQGGSTHLTSREAQDMADAALAAIADDPGLVEVLGNTLRAHQPTTGMSVASGVTCRCGYWNGNEVGGKTRPVGYQGLQWHQANVLADVVRAWLRGA